VGIATFLILYLSWVCKVPSEEWEKRYPAAIPVATAAFVIGGILYVWLLRCDLLVEYILSHIYNCLFLVLEFYINLGMLVVVLSAADRLVNCILSVANRLVNHILSAANRLVNHILSAADRLFNRILSAEG